MKKENIKIVKKENKQNYIEFKMRTFTVWNFIYKKKMTQIRPDLISKFHKISFRWRPLHSLSYFRVKCLKIKKKIYIIYQAKKTKC